MGFWDTKRVVVTGGAGFLGSYVVQELARVGCRRIIVPRSAEYDLRDLGAVRRLYADAAPDLVIHLAARVGGIGANRENPGRFFYDNLMMGMQLMHEACGWPGVEKFVAVGTVCAYPKYHPGAVPRGRPLERLPGGDQRALRPGQEDAAGAGPGLPPAVRLQRASTCCRSTSTAPATTSIPSSSHVIPALIKKCVEARRRRGSRRSTCGATAAPRASSCTSTTPPRAIVLAAERYDGAEPVNLGAGPRDHDPRARRR